MNDTWPPTYDDTYLPDPKDQHWFQDRETMDPEEREGSRSEERRVGKECRL